MSYQEAKALAAGAGLAVKDLLPHKDNRIRKHSQATKDRIAELRARGVPLKAIGKLCNVPWGSVAGLALSGRVQPKPSKK